MNYTISQVKCACLVQDVYIIPQLSAKRNYFCRYLESVEYMDKMLLGHGPSGPWSQIKSNQSNAHDGAQQRPSVTREFYSKSLINIMKQHLRSAFWTFTCLAAGRQLPTLRHWDPLAAASGIGRVLLSASDSCKLLSALRLKEDPN